MAELLFVNPVAEGNVKASVVSSMSSILTARHFHNELAAYQYIEARLWPNGPICPHCGNTNPKRVYPLRGQTNRIGLRKCGECRKPFNVKLGTVFESSHRPLHIWLQAIYLMYSSDQYIGRRTLWHALNVSMNNKKRMSQRSVSKRDNPAQSKRFIKMARQLGADQDDDALQRTLGIIAAKRSTPKRNTVVGSLRLDIPSTIHKAPQKTEVEHSQALTILAVAWSPETSGHVTRMGTLHHPGGTIYRIVGQKGPTYAVEVTKPRIPPTTMCGFRTAAEAKAWIKAEKLKTRQAEKLKTKQAENR